MPPDPAQCLQFMEERRWIRAKKKARTYAGQGSHRLQEMALGGQRSMPDQADRPPTGKGVQHWSYKGYCASGVCTTSQLA